MPSGRWKPETTPSAVSSASRWPEITSILVRQICSAAAMKSLPLRASRQAAVASTHSRSTCMVSHSARKRFSAASAFSTASDGSRPLVCTSRPRPASVFSLNSGVGLRVTPS